MTAQDQRPWPADRTFTREDFARAFRNQFEVWKAGNLLITTHNDNNPGDVTARAERSRNARRAAEWAQTREDTQ